MKIRIYQIAPERDTCHLLFLDYEAAVRVQGCTAIHSASYEKVFEGNVNCRSLEDVFRKFNCELPKNYKARSLSVSDVVEVIESESVTPGFYFCDTLGFKEVPFEPEAARTSPRFCCDEKADTISILLVQPGTVPKQIELENTLEAKQQVVGGDIEALSFFPDEVAFICNSEGKSSGLPLNRAIYARDLDGAECAENEIVDIITGNFLIVGAPSVIADFTSLPPNMMDKFMKRFAVPELFARSAKGIVAIPYRRK